MHGSPQDSVSLDALLERAGDGDHDAVATLYDLAASRVYGVALRVLRNHDLAEDVTQEVFVEVWQKAATFDAERGSAGSWIATIAHHMSVDRVRTAQSAQRRDLAWHDDRTTSTSTNTSDFTQSSVESLELQAALSSLTPLQRAAIQLAYFEGHTYQDVARIMGTPLGTTKTRIRDARHRLQMVMAIPQAETA